MPPETRRTALQALSGRSFGSAKEFTAAVGVTLGPGVDVRMESKLVECARTDRYYWIAVLLMACAAAGHQSWSANLFTVVSDVFPKAAIASLIGIGGHVRGRCGLGR